jgi:hypothetical protein
VLSHHRDVDDLEDISQLEAYVLASQAVLLFLSNGCDSVILELNAAHSHGARFAHFAQP